MEEDEKKVESYPVEGEFVGEASKKVIKRIATIIQCQVGKSFGFAKNCLQNKMDLDIYDDWKIERLFNPEKKLHVNKFRSNNDDKVDQQEKRLAAAATTSN